MSLQTSDFSGLTDDLQSIFNEVSKNKVAENVGFKVFDVKDTDRRTYDHRILHGLAGVRRVSQSQDLPRVSGEQGDSATYTQERFGAIVPITKDMRKFELYDEMNSLVKSITEDAWDKIDQSMADVLLKGWSTSYTDVYGNSVASTGPDGLALFSASHTNPINSNTRSNLIVDSSANTDPILSRATIVHWRAQGMKALDVNGLVRPINYDTVIVSPEKVDLAERILYSEYLPGSANNDKNTLKGKVNIVVWPRAAVASDGTDTDDYWFMYDSKLVKESLKALFAERPSLDAPEEVYANKDWEYSMDFYYALGRGYPLYVAGSKGTT